MTTLLSRIGRTVALGALILELAAGGVFAGNNGVTASPEQKPGMSTIDYKNAKELPLPTANVPAMRQQVTYGIQSEMQRRPGFSPGSFGSGIMQPTSVALPETAAGISPDAAPGDDATSMQQGPIVPQEYGSGDINGQFMPFTTSRVDVTKTNAVSRLYPFRAAGKLWFKEGSDTYMCSASLIKRGIVVTAAHCVANFGQQQFYSDWQFIPAMYGTTAPYGKWKVAKAYIMTGYYDGTGSCAQPGVICQDDVAVLVITPKLGVYPGTSVGWLGYGWDGYGFSPNSDVLVNQLGYPAALDAGRKMQRTDSAGWVDPDNSNNTIWGSRQTGGSSGGPEIINLGAPAVLSNGISQGNGAAFNTVIGVTSWGYTDPAVEQQGASPFLSTNVKALVDAACAYKPKACQ